MTDAPLPGLGVEYDVPEWMRARMGQRCRTCGAPVVWAITRDPTPETGRPKTMPVDPVPSTRGNLVVWLDGGTMRARVDKDATGPKWLSHFVTCSQASSHRRKR